MALTKVIGNGLGATQEGAITFNEGSADVDFRVESNGNANMINVDGGNDRVGLGIAPSFNVHIDKSSTNTTLTDLTDAQLVLSNTGSATTNQHVKLGFRFQDGSVNGQSMIAAVRESGSSRASSLRFYTGPASDGDPDEAMRITSTGAITKPLQPAFLVGMSTNSAQFGNGQFTPTLDTEIFDQNADFGSNTFTAPVTGRYYLSWIVYAANLDTSASYYYLKLATSNREYSKYLYTSSFDADVLYYGWHTSVLADMDVNDTATFHIGQVNGHSTSQVYASNTYASGALIC